MKPSAQHRSFLFLSLFSAIGVIAADRITTAEIPASQPVLLPMTPSQTRNDFLAMIDRPRIDPAPQVSAPDITDGIATIRFSYASEINQRVPGILLARPEILQDGHRHPVTIILHGTGQNKESELTLLQQLATKGFVGVAIDARYHGQRGNQDEYNAAIAKAYADGKSHPLYFDEVWDQMRLIDYLQTRADVDPHRIGMMGISKGGIETWLTAAVDPRVAVAIPCISVQSFDWGLDNDSWHGRISTVQKSFDAVATANGIEKPDAAFVRKFYDHLLPGIYTKFDGPQMLPLIAPRPMLIISGDKDPMNPLPGLRLCEQNIQAAYAKQNASDHLKVIVQANTGHAVNKAAHAAAIAWFEKWLGDNSSAAEK